jgi:hypothetical protein
MNGPGTWKLYSQSVQVRDEVVRRHAFGANTESAVFALRTPVIFGNAQSRLLPAYFLISAQKSASQTRLSLAASVK